MESSANRARSPVYFLDFEGLDRGEQQRVCQILGVPVPKAESVPHPSASEHEETPESVVGHDSNGGHVEFGVAISTSEQALVNQDAGVAVPVPAPHHMVPVPVAVVTGNPLAAATIATVGMRMVSMPGGIPAMPGVHGLHGPAFVHPDFYRNQPPPNMGLNPHVQEFVPGHEYILPGDGSKPVTEIPAQPPQQLPPPIFMPGPVPFVPHNYPVPNNGMPAGPGAPQEVALGDAGVADASLVHPQAAGMQGPPPNLTRSEPATPVQLPGNVSGVSGETRPGVARNPALTPNTASVSVQSSKNRPADSQVDIESRVSTVAHTGAHSDKPAVAIGSHDTAQVQSIVSSGSEGSVPSPCEPGVPEKSLKVSAQVTVDNLVSSTGVHNSSSMTEKDSKKDSNSSAASSTAPRTSTVTTVTPQQNTPQSDSVSSSISSDTTQPVPQTGFPALGQSESAVGLVNGVIPSETHGAKDTAPDAKPVADGAESKAESSQPQTAAAPAKMSWANLFKGSNAPSKPAVVIYKEDTEKPTTTPAPPPSQSQAPAPAEVVSVADDSVAKKLGEFMAKVTLTHSSIALQPRGLVNRGNWCYVNATLQALVACPPFYHLFKKLAELPFLSRTASSTPILDSLVQFTSEFNKFERQGNTKKGKHVELVPGLCFEPDYIYKMLQLSKASSSFKHGHQEDAEEFLSYVLDGLHDEMLSAIKHATGGENGTSQMNGFAGSPESDPSAENNDEGSESEDWQEVGPRNRGAFTRTAGASTSENTPISEMFVGCVRSGIFQAAAKERATLQPFFTLQLDIQEDKVASVREALEHFVSKESIQGYTCSKTGEKVEVVKRTTLEKLPPVLILHLKCFVYDQAGGCQKLLKNIKFDVDLQITKDLLSTSAKNRLHKEAQRLYKLFAVVFHHGKKATGGHYTTDVFHPGINGWVHMDDSRILPVQELDVLNYRPPKMPYLLYYRRRDLTNIAATGASS